MPDNDTVVNSAGRAKHLSACSAPPGSPHAPLPAWRTEGSALLALQAGRRVISNYGWYLDGQVPPGPSHLLFEDTWLNFYGVDPVPGEATPEMARLLLGGEASMWGEQVRARRRRLVRGCLTPSPIPRWTLRMWSPASGPVPPPPRSGSGARPAPRTSPLPPRGSITTAAVWSGCVRHCRGATTEHAHRLHTRTGAGAARDSRSRHQARRRARVLRDPLLRALRLTQARQQWEAPLRLRLHLCLRLRLRQVDHGSVGSVCGGRAGARRGLGARGRPGRRRCRRRRHPPQRRLPRRGARRSAQLDALRSRWARHSSSSRRLAGGAATLGRSDSGSGSTRPFRGRPRPSLARLGGGLRSCSGAAALAGSGAL